jgi:hypothetical protein
LIHAAITAGASRVAPDPLCLHAVATTPAGPMERIRSILLHRRRPSPDYSWVGSCIISFEACSAFTHVTTCRLTKSPYATLYTGGSDGFVASTAAPIATGWSDPVPGRVYLPLWSSAFHGALLTPDCITQRSFCLTGGEHSCSDECHLERQRRSVLPAESPRSRKSLAAF